MTVTLTLLELAGIVAGAVGLAATDAAALSRLAIAYTAKKLGVEPQEVTSYDRATDGEE